MSLRHPKASKTGSRRWIRMLLASAAGVVIAVPGMAGAGAGTSRPTDDDAQMIADVMRVVHANFATYNDQKWDEFRVTYTEDAVFLPPGYDPVRRRDAITEAHRRFRDLTGPVDLDSIEIVRARANGKIDNLVYTFTAQSGHLRAVADVLYERQADGSVLLGVDQVGFRGQPVG